MSSLTRTAMAFVMMAPLIISLPLSLEATSQISWSAVASVYADRGRAHDEEDGRLGGTIWGSVKHYTDSDIVVNGRSYPFHKNVVIDTYSLRKDDRGNVRITLDAYGKVTGVFFYGIDMPDVIRRYKM